MEIKEFTRDRILQYYKKYGLSVAIEIARKLLGNRINVTADMRTSINGEICESVLEITLLEYMKDHPSETKDWCWGKSLILKDPDSNSDFLTELDFTLFTPECVYVFECKSYAGDKIIRDKGIIERKGKKDFDVFKQNLIHLETLDKWIRSFSETPNYQMVLFDFSNGTSTDIRSKKYKEYLPHVTEKDVLFLIQKGVPVWDMKYLRRCLDSLEKDSVSLHEKHLKYVKGLHGGK